MLAIMRCMGPAQSGTALSEDGYEEKKGKKTSEKEEINFDDIVLDHLE